MSEGASSLPLVDKCPSVLRLLSSSSARDGVGVGGVQGSDTRAKPLEVAVVPGSGRIRWVVGVWECFIAETCAFDVGGEGGNIAEGLGTGANACCDGRCNVDSE